MECERKPRPDVLLSTIACNPLLGSEPGVGWRWVSGLAGKVGLTVLTRTIHRDAIERHLETAGSASALLTVRFEYLELPEPWFSAERRGCLPYGLYYVLWQWLASRRYRGLAEAHDIVHHLTLCSVVCPGFWSPNRAKFVMGPTGIPLVNRHYLHLFGAAAGIQAARNWMLMRFDRLPWLWGLRQRTEWVVPANDDARALLQARGMRVRPVMLDTGAPEIDPGEREGKSRGEVCRFIYAGRLERRKGLELTIRALARASLESDFRGSLEIIGSGPDRKRLENLCRRLGLGDRVDFTGAIPRNEVMGKFAVADAFVFTSLRDTSAGVNLEAMACGLPLLCLAHQGVGQIATDGCAIRVDPGPVDATVAALAVAMRRMAASPELRRSLGSEARRRAIEDFSWDEKIAMMVCHYRQALREGTVPEAPGHVRVTKWSFSKPRDSTGVDDVRASKPEHFGMPFAGHIRQP